MLRLSFIFLCGVIVAGCTHTPDTRATHPVFYPSPPRTAADFISPMTPAEIAVYNKKTPPQKAKKQANVKQPKLPLAYHHTVTTDVTLSMVSFDNREHQLRVADQQKGPGTRWVDAKSSAATYRGLAAINGGFFTPEGKPLGLLIETGSKRGHINKSSLGAGIFVSTPSNSTIIRRQHYAGSSLAARAYNLLQTGPMLAEQGKTITGLSKTSRRRRSFIAWDGNNHWAIGYAEPCTLDELSRALAGQSPAGFKIHTAVNLDGGRSSDLWAGPHVKNGNKTHRTFFNKPARNYLVLIPR